MNIKMFRRFALLSAITVVGVGAAGCGSNVARNVDVSQGEYYTAEEFKSLSREQRDAYCSSLDQELARLNDAEASAQGETGNLQSQLSGVQNEVRQLQSRLDGAKGELDGVQKDIDYFEGLPKVHVVESGEFLYKISGYERIYADPLKWPRIYRANKGRINDPNLIYPDWELTIPRDWPRTWTVKKDEYLSKIAWYWEVYDDPSEWPKLYEANRDKIRDPNMIWPDWELTIPRN